MYETPQIPRNSARSHAWRAAATPNVASHAAQVLRRPQQGRTDDMGDDPVTDWLLQRDDLAATEFSVLFAIHKLRARRQGAGWVRRTDLCRSTRLDPAALGRVLSDLRARGLVWIAHHPVKTGYARYLLIVQ